MGALLDEWKKNKRDKTEESGSLLEEWRTGKKYGSVDTSGVNDAYFEAYNQAANSFFSDKELQENSYDRWQGLTKQADTIRAWAWQNRDKLGSNYDAIMSATDLSEAGQYWNQFKTAEDYAKAYGDYVSYKESDSYIYDNIVNSADYKTKSASGWEKYVSDRDARNKVAVIGEEDESFWDMLGRWMGSGGPSDSTLPLSGVTQVQNAVRDNPIKREPGQEWSDEQRAIFGYLYDTDPAKAEEYAAYADLENEYAAIADIQNKASANLGAGVLHSLGALAASPLGLADVLNDLALGEVSTGTDGSVSPFEYSQAAMSGITERLNKESGTIPDAVPIIGGKGLGDVYGLGMNVAQSTLSAYTLGSAGTLVSYFGQGAASAMQEAKARGASDAQATVYGVAAGVFEGLAEKIGVDNLFKLGGTDTLKGLVVNVLKQAGAEGSEEGLTSLLTNIADNVILQDNSAFYELVDQYVASGMTEREAKTRAWMELAEGIAYDTIAGAASGGISGGGHTIGTSIIENKAENKAYKDTYGQSQRDLVSEGLELDPQSAYFKRLEQKLEKGKNLTGGELRGAVSMNQQAVREGDISKMKKAIEKRLEELGETVRISAKAKALAKQAAGEELSAIDKITIGSSKYGQRVAWEMSPETIDLGSSFSQWAEEIGTDTINAEAYNKRLQEEVSEDAQNAPKISSESLKRIGVQTVTERENAPVTEQTAAQAEVTRETSQEVVQAQLAEASKGYGAQAKAMVATYLDGQDVAEYDAAFRIAYDMGASGVRYSYVEGMKSYLKDSQKKIAYEAGKASQDEKAKAREQEIAKQATGGTKRKKGVVRGEGVSLEQLSKKANDTQREAYSIFSFFAEISGINIALYESKADLQGNFKGAQGMYKESDPGTLYIDVNAGLNNIKSAGDLANYTMLRTFSHEFVHFIENYNPVWYNELRRVVFDHLENADELISREAAETGKDYEYASREVVAEALTDILPDSSFIEDLANNHKNIFEKLYAKLKEFVANIKKHFASLTPNTNKALQTLKQSGKYGESILEVFNKAALGAVENYQNTVAEQQAEPVKEEVKAEPKEKSLYEKYSDIKAQHPDSIVLYRVGDFYEILGEDAKVASEAADLTLSGRNDPVHGRVSMVGFPYRTVGAYAEKLRTVSRVAIVEEDGNVIEMSKTEAQQIDQEKPKKAKKPKKIASTEAVIPEESADTAQVEQESAKSDVTVEQAKKNLKKAVTMPIQGTNEEALLAGIRSKELTFDMVSYHGNYPGFSPVQRAHLVEKLIEGVYTEDKVIKIDVPYDGKFEINNTPEIVASALHTLKVRVPQEIVWDKKAFTHFKNEGRVAVMKHGGRDYITDGELMLPITDSAARIATRELRADFMDYPKGFDELAENATVPVTNAPYEAEIKGRAVYVFDIGGEKVYFDKKRFAFIDGGVLTYAKGEKFSVIKSINADGSLIGYLINVRSPKTDIEDGKPTKLKSFSKKKGAKGEVQYSRRSYAEQDQAYMDAVESGDMETAQRMVDEAAKEAGYTKKAYHGTPNAEFTVFDKDRVGKGNDQYGAGFYFATSKEAAAHYGRRVIDSALNIKKPIRITATADSGNNLIDADVMLTSNQAYKVVKRLPGIYDAEESPLGDYFDAYWEVGAEDWMIRELAEQYRDVGYLDSDLFRNYPNELHEALRDVTGYDGVEVTFERTGEKFYVAWFNNQIKSAEAVTYDDDGNVIPLSERFDEAQEDIRYQRRANYAPGLTSGKPGEGMSYEVSVKDYTLKEVSNLYHLGNLGAEYDELFNKAYAFCEKASIHFAGVPSVDNKKGGQAHGASFADKIKLNQQWFNRTDVTNERKSKTILHEMLHSSTVYAITAYNEAKEGEILNELPKHIRRSCEEFLQVYEAIRKNPSFDGQYALKSVEEMVAELANQAFVNKLKDTYPSGWHMILQGICNILGINKSFSNYDKLRRAAERILLDPDFELAQGYYESLQSQNASYLDESQYADADVQEQLTLEDTDASYMAAVEDGDTETLQRMVEKAAREAGFDSPKLYHGTNTFGFTSIDTKKSNDRVSFFATDSLETAGTYSGTNRVREIGEQSASSLGIYQFYANTEGMLELDADGSESNHVKLDGIEKKFNDFMMTRSWRTHATAKQIAKYAKQSGYSGVIIKNVIDTATPESRSAANTSTVYIFFDPQKQLASADTVTYDDDGNVVPLSERFSSESTDIRYQRRDGRMTDQEVLAYAVDMYESDPSSMALSDAEKNAFELFKQRLAKLDDLTEQRYEQGQIYRENTFQKGGDRELAQKAHNRMEVLDGQIARASAQLLDVQEKTVLQGVLQKARKVVEQQERARGDEKLKRWRERREEATQKKKYLTRVMAARQELIDWLNHPMNKDVSKHVNENVKGIVINFLLSIDPASASSLKKGETTKADMKHAEQAKMLKEMLFGDNAPIDYSAYDLPLNFDERLNAHIEVVRQLTEQYGGDKVLGEMSAEQLKQLSVIMANLQTALKNLNRFHANSTFVRVDDGADNTLRFLKTLKTRVGKKFDRFLNWKNTRSSWIWQRFGEGGKSIEKELRAGQATLARNAKKVIDFAEKTFTAKEQKSWSREIVEVTISGDRKVRLSVGMLMGFYELSKREQGRKHILDGGITLEEVDIKQKGEKKERIMGKYARLTEADIELLNSKLTDRQKEVADALQKFMEKVGADWGNYVTLARFGEKAYGEVGYYPITVDPTSVDSNAPVKQQQGADLYRLLNMSFTHELSKNTSGRVMVYNIFDVFSNHMADMAQYNAMALPVLDAIRWLNYKTYEYDGDERRAKDNLRDELRRAFGADAKSNVGYAEDFVTSILKAYNGTEAQGTPEDAWGVGFMHKFNRAQIAYNLRVVVQQPMSVIRAAMVINPKYLIKALKALDPAKLKENINEMLEHSGIALWKDLGYYDINISRGLTQMVKQEEGVFDKVTGWGMKPAEWADKVSWLIMWNAAKLEMADKGVTDLSKVSDAFDEIIYKTQVVDSVLTKTQYMRDKGFFARTSAAFMSEPVATASMALGVFDEIRMDMAQGATFRQAFGNHKGDVARVLTVYAVSSVMLAAVQSIVDAWRDDDEYEDFGEKWLEAFAGNFLDEATPLNKIPIISYVWDVAKIGVDTFTDLDVYGNIPGSALTQWVESLVKLMEIVEEQINGESNYTLFADIYKVLQLAGMSGLPIAPMYREFVAFWNNVIGIMAPSMKIKNYELKEETEIKYAVMDGYLTADEAADELMKQELVYDREEAEMTAELWAFLKDHKEYSDVSVSAYAKYKENCDGIDFGYFYQAWKYYSQTDADRDKDGEPISGSKKRKVLDFIYQMRLTPAQKKQLIKCFYK